MGFIQDVLFYIPDSVACYTGWMWCYSSCNAWHPYPVITYHLACSTGPSTITFTIGLKMLRLWSSLAPIDNCSFCSSLLISLAQYNLVNMCVLSLAGMELIFFMAACTVLCFAFVIKTLLITHQCLAIAAVLAQRQGFIFFPLCLLQWVGWGG